MESVAIESVVAELAAVERIVMECRAMKVNRLKEFIGSFFDNGYST